MWDVRAYIGYKAGKLARSLHVSEERATDLILDFEQELCYDDGCAGKLRMCGTKGVTEDANCGKWPKEIYYQCLRCNAKWAYDFQLNIVTHW